jgi:hypothetical protein
MDVCIISTDQSYARLLELELAEQHLRAEVAKAYTFRAREAYLIVLDLDSCGEATIPPEKQVVGFSRTPDALPAEQRERCAALLRRPFRMDEFRSRVWDCGSWPSDLRPDARPTEALYERSPDLLLDFETKTVTYGDRQVRLSGTEFSVLSCLYENRGATVSKEDLEALVGRNETESNKVEVYVCLVRRKLEATFSRKWIWTVRGAGYVFR